MTKSERKERCRKPAFWKFKCSFIARIDKQSISGEKCPYSPYAVHKDAQFVAALDSQIRRRISTAKLGGETLGGETLGGEMLSMNYIDRPDDGECVYKIEIIIYSGKHNAECHSGRASLGFVVAPFS